MIVFFLWLWASEWHPLGPGLPTSGQWRQGFCIVTYNGQQHLVLPPARKGEGEIQSFFWDKDHWLSGFKITSATKMRYGDLISCDLDQNGAVDLVLVEHQGRLWRYELSPNGWVESNIAAFPGGFSSRALATGIFKGGIKLWALGEGRASRPTLDGPFGVCVLHAGSWHRVEGIPLTFGDRLWVEDFFQSGETSWFISSRDGRLKNGFGGVLFEKNPDLLVDSPCFIWDIAVSKDQVAFSGRFLKTGNWVEGLGLISWKEAKASIRWEILPVRATAVCYLDSETLVYGTLDGSLYLWGRGVSTEILSSRGCQVYRLGTWDMDNRQGLEILACLAGEDPSCSNGGEVICLTR